MSLFICRHAESLGNIGHDHEDPRLSDLGHTQAALLSGSFDLVICSPLTRAQQTLHLSRIEARIKIFDPACRERVFSPKDCLVGETVAQASETNGQFWCRADKFLASLAAYQLSFERVLIMSHAYFLAGTFYREPRYLPHAEIIPF